MIILLRHLKPDIAAGICYGRLDVPLAAGWRRQTARLHDELPPLSRILTSPLQRARLLAEALGEWRQVEVGVVSDLAEIDFGAWEGRSWDEIGRAALDRWAADPEHFREHGGESAAQLRTRVKKALQSYREERDLLLVTHAGVIRAALGQNHADDWRRPAPFGSTHILEPVS